MVVEPALFPAFDLEVSDYVVRCSGQPVQVTVETEPGASASIDGGEFGSGLLSRSVALAHGQAFTVRTRSLVFERVYHVRCVPPDFPRWTFERSSRPTAAYHLLTPVSGAPSLPRYVAMFDRNGVPIWWFKGAAFPLDARVLTDGNLAWARYDGSTFANGPAFAYEVRRLDGSLVDVISTVGNATDFHDLVELGNGSFLALTYRPRDGVDLTAYGGPASATVVDAEIQHLDPAGAVVWTWNSKDHVALSETERWWPYVLGRTVRLSDGRRAHDVTHINSIEVDGDSIVLSLRHTDAVYKIDRATGAIQWKLGGTPTPKSLTVLADPYARQPLGAQHDARVLDDGSVTVHDNATMLGRPPRGVRYAIDEAARTATLVESVVDPDVTDSQCCGSARRLSGRSWVFSWGGVSSVTELTVEGSRVFRLSFGFIVSYRAVPVPDGLLSLDALRQGMSAMFPR